MGLKRMALVATLDVALGFLFLGAVAVVARLPPSPPDVAPRPDAALRTPDTAQFIAEEVASRLSNRFANVTAAGAATVRLPALFAIGSAGVSNVSCETAGAVCVAGGGGLVPAQDVLDDLAHALHEITMEFATDQHAALRTKCAKRFKQACPGVLTGIFIEGHADRNAYDKGASGGNSALAVQRALTAYKAVVAQHPTLATLEPAIQSAPGPVLAFAGYSCRRPAFNADAPSRFSLTPDQLEEHCDSRGNPANQDEEAKNRRIEIRFVVSQPQE